MSMRSVYTEYIGLRREQLLLMRGPTQEAFRAVYYNKYYYLSLFITI